MVIENSTKSDVGLENFSRIVQKGNTPKLTKPVEEEVHHRHNK